MSTRDSATALSGNALRVLRMYAEGYSAREMADELGIAPTTVTEYLRRIKNTYGVSSRRELMRLAELTKENA